MDLAQPRNQTNLNFALNETDGKRWSLCSSAWFTQHGFGLFREIKLAPLRKNAVPFRKDYYFTAEMERCLEETSEVSFCYICGQYD